MLQKDPTSSVQRLKESLINKTLAVYKLLHVTVFISCCKVIACYRFYLYVIQTARNSKACQQSTRTAFQKAQ